MITVEEALKIISEHTVDFGVESIPLSESINRILKEDWTTDRDLPPYDRVTMDGIAINFDAFEKGNKSFPIEGVAAAGSPQQSMKNSGACLEVMTGSILPSNTDTVIRYEDLDIIDGKATLQIDNLRKTQNIHFKGEDKKAGQQVANRNTKISPAEIGLGASIGKAKVQVSKLPKVMVISTGDELVQINEQPLEHQIRRSNVYRLVTSLKSYNISADTDHLNDNPTEIKASIAKYLDQYDAIILSGGVSKGKFDYLPQVLEELGVTKLFHKIKQRPGKPFWFGKFKEQCTIFALPGNPVSSFLCMQRYFRYWLELSQNGQVPELQYAVLGEDVFFKPDLTYYLEVKLNSGPDGKVKAKPMKGNGSGDLANLTVADAFIELPLGRNEFLAGEVFPYYSYR